MGLAKITEIIRKVTRRSKGITGTGFWPGSGPGSGSGPGPGSGSKQLAVPEEKLRFPKETLGLPKEKFGFPERKVGVTHWLGSGFNTGFHECMRNGQWKVQTY